MEKVYINTYLEERGRIPSLGTKKRCNLPSGTAVNLERGQNLTEICL